MATLIPALSTCVSRMTSGERRLAERLESKLDDDYLLQLVGCGSEWKDPALFKLPVENRIRCGDFDPSSHKIMVTKVNKGLECPVAAEDVKDAAQVFYVAATRTTQRLLISESGDAVFE